jgi:hypothetical protein
MAIVGCIEVALMRRGNANYYLVWSKLKNLYNYDIGDCINRLEYLRIVLKEVYKQDYNSVLKDITWELEILEISEINDFKTEFCKIMAS